MTTHPLPDLYARWTEELLGAPAPGEPLATCEDCAMCVKEDGRIPTSLFAFDPELKCCVYTPRLPNFVVGRALTLEGAGGESVAQRIQGVASSPLGVDRDPSYDLLHRNTVNAIGRSKTLRCPHFVDGGCSIYEARDATCSTWFCRHERGAVGGRFWRALRQLLSCVELELARWCALELGLTADGLVGHLPRSPDEAHVPEAPVDAAHLDASSAPAPDAAAWGRWAGYEADFYRACAKRAAALTWEQVLEICGTEVRVRSDVVRARYRDLTREGLPKTLRVGSFEVVGAREGGVRAVTYSSLDAIDLPSALVGLLPRFDGRPTDEVLEELKVTYGVELEDAFLQRLIDWGVLVAG